MKLDRIQPDSCTKGRALTVRRVEKSGASSILHGKHERRALQAPTYSGRGGRTGLSRFEAYNPSRLSQNGMQAGFVAQVLGQALESKPESAALAARVYARSARGPKGGRLIRVL